MAKRLKADEELPSLSHQRIAQLANEDPDFPPVVTVGRAKAVDWHAAQQYVRTRKGAGQGRRTDLEAKRAKEQSDRPNEGDRERG
jgi:hypothetical protein